MAQLISRVFNPLLNPVIAFALLIFVAPKMAVKISPAAQMFYFTIAAVFSSFVIFGYIYYLKHKRVIQSTELIVREHRINPLTFAVLSYALGFFFLTLFQAPAIVRGLMFCYVTNTMVVLLITRRWKISIHTTAMANPLVAIVHQFGWMFAPILVLVPLVGFSRVKMGRHDLWQVTAGGLLGVLMTALQLSFF
jgi:membrane-associated phospholipid phosphatase